MEASHAVLARHFGNWRNESLQAIGNEARRVGGDQPGGCCLGSSEGEVQSGKPMRSQHLQAPQLQVLVTGNSWRPPQFADTAGNGFLRKKFVQRYILLSYYLQN